MHIILAVVLAFCPAPAAHHHHHNGHGGKQIFCPAGTHRDRDGDRCIPGTIFPH